MGQVTKATLRAKRRIENGHWIFTGSPGRAYGKIRIGPRSEGREISVHRLAWILWRGEIPDDWDVHHKCDERRCFNPAHLKAMSKRKHRRTHTSDVCSRGHRLDDPANVYVRPNGTRMCRACRKIRKFQFPLDISA